MHDPRISHRRVLRELFRCDVLDERILNIKSNRCQNDSKRQLLHLQMELSKVKENNLIEQLSERSPPRLETSDS